MISKYHFARFERAIPLPNSPMRLRRLSLLKHRRVIAARLRADIFHALAERSATVGGKLN